MARIRICSEVSVRAKDVMGYSTKEALTRSTLVIVYLRNSKSVQGIVVGKKIKRVRAALNAALGESGSESAESSS